MPEQLPESGAEILARIKPVLREATTEICLRPDLIDAWEEATTELTASQMSDSTNRRLGTGVSAATRRAAEKVQTIEAEIQAIVVKFHFRALSTDKWEALCAKHPPRKGNDIDAWQGHDREAVANAAVRACLVDPVFDDKSWAELRSVCPPPEWNELKETVGVVHPQAVGVPKSEMASQILSRRANGSKSPGTGTPVPASSTGGRRARSTSTSTPTGT